MNNQIDPPVSRRCSKMASDGTDQYGTIEEHVGTCRTCNRRVVGGGSYDGFESVERELASHIDDGTDCHDYSIQAVYQDGGERRVA